MAEQKPHPWEYYGPSGHRPKLTPAQWEEVGRRFREGEAAMSLAQEFGISASSIYGKGWKRD
jgi:hypothetical protein